jgi:hypothetical protein
MMQSFRPTRCLHLTTEGERPCTESEPAPGREVKKSRSMNQHYNNMKSSIANMQIRENVVNLCFCLGFFFFAFFSVNCRCVVNDDSGERRESCANHRTRADVDARQHRQIASRGNVHNQLRHNKSARQNRHSEPYSCFYFSSTIQNFVFFSSFYDSRNSNRTLRATAACCGAMSTFRSICRIVTHCNAKFRLVWSVGNCELPRFPPLSASALRLSLRSPHPTAFLQ